MCGGRGCKDVLPVGHRSQPRVPLFLFSSCFTCCMESGQAGEHRLDPDLLSRNLESCLLLCVGPYFHFLRQFCFLLTRYLFPLMSAKGLLRSLNLSCMVRELQMVEIVSMKQSPQSLGAAGGLFLGVA